MKYFTNDTWKNVHTLAPASQADDNAVSGDSMYAPYYFVTVSEDANYNNFYYNNSVYVRDNDRAEVSVFPSNGKTSEAGGTANFNVKLTSRPAAAVVIEFKVNDGTEGEVIQGKSVKFTPNDWAASKVVVVRGKDDQVEDGSQPYRLTVSVSSHDKMYDKYDVAPRRLFNGRLLTHPLTHSLTHSHSTPSHTHTHTHTRTHSLTHSLTLSHTRWG